MKIEVLKDTTIVKDNTADSLAVVLTKEEAVTEFTTTDGKVVRGDNLIVEEKSSTNLGELKLQKSLLEAEANTIQIKINEINVLIDSIQPEVDKAIQEIIELNKI